jgi:hypothetical protein
MRLSAKNVYANVAIVAESASRPLRMQIGGNVYRMDSDEAIALATMLVAVVDEVKSTEGTQQ